jgi:membrane protein EpsK
MASHFCEAPEYCIVMIDTSLMHVTSIVSRRNDHLSRPVTNSQGRFLINLTSNVGTLGLSVLVGFWYTPFLVNSLGTETYGMIGLASSFVVYLSLATVGLNSAVGRYLTIALERGYTEEANKVFNTSLFGTLAVVVALLAPISLLALHVESFLQIPPGQTETVRSLFLLAAAAFLIGTLSGPFAVATFARNRFDIRSGIATAELVTRIGVVIALFYWFSPTLHYVGYGFVAAAFVSAAGSYWSWRRLVSELSVSWKATEWKTFWELSTMSGWVLINHVGTILFLNVDLLIINHVLGPHEGGRYAALLQLSMVLRSLAGSVAGVFGPTIMHLVAQNNRSQLLKYTKQSVRILGLLLALPIGLTCGFSKSLLTLWLGPAFTELWPLLTLMILPLTINLIVLPLFSINIALNKITLPGYATCALGIINCLLSWLLAGPAHWGLYGVALAGAIVLSLKNALLTPYYAAHILEEHPRILLHSLLTPAFLTSLLTGLLIGADFCLPAATWPQLIVRTLLASLFYCVLVNFAILTAEERETQHRYLASLLQRKL